MHQPPASAGAEAIKFDAPPPIALVQQAIKSLYHDPKPENKESAGRWLSAMQSSIYGWKVADELLIGRADVETCYFAAHTLRSKLQHNFAELPVEAYVSLKDSIINHLATINEHVIQTQLALCITYLAILGTSAARHACFQAVRSEDACHLSRSHFRKFAKC